MIITHDCQVPAHSLTKHFFEEISFVPPLASVVDTNVLFEVQIDPPF